MMPFDRVATIAVATSWLVLAGACARATSQAPDGGGARQAATAGTGSGTGCPVRGVWELVSMSANGMDQPLGGYRQRKVVTERHYMWIGHAARRDTLPLRTELDSLRAFQMGGGAGTYTTSGDTYTEQLDYFYIPSWVGRSFRATCRVEGDRWYHSFMSPNDPTAPGPFHRIVEVWRRVE